MENKTAMISREEAMEVLVHYIECTKELKQLINQVDLGRENNWQRWIEIKEKYTFIVNDVKRHYDYLNLGETFGTVSAFFEAAIRDIYVSTSVLNVDMDAEDFLHRLTLLLVEIEGYATFWLPQTHTI
jgi:predicted hydrolase (HD superfamily)